MSRIERKLYAAVVLTAATLGACVPVEYVKSGATIQTRQGEAVVFGRIRFMDDGRERYAWDPSISDFLFRSTWPRHIWLRGLDRTAITPELHPDKDGSLAVRLRAGDYALLATDEEIGVVDSTTRFEIVALLRVPANQPLVYAGDVILVTRHPEGWTRVRRALGEPVLDYATLESATAALEAKYGKLPAPLAASHWCVSSELPVINDYEGLQRSRELLERGCPP